MPPQNVTQATVTRLEKKLDEVVTGQGHILERLASIEATSKAEASERATVNNYTQGAISQLQNQLTEEKRSRAEEIKALWDQRETDRLADQARARWAIGIALSGLLFPIIVGLIFALTNGATP